MSNVIDMTGKEFGELIVIERDFSKKGRAFWFCKCSCGKIISVMGKNLRSGNTKSCGHLIGKNLKENALNLIGEKFGRLEVIQRDEERVGVFWLCKCDCGKIVSVKGTNLKNGNTKSCGCLNIEKISERRLIDLTGQVFGKLTVLSRGENKGKETCWKCRCECGNIVNIRGSCLKRGETKSCGCLASEGEFLIEKCLKNLGVNYKKQYSFSDLKGVTFPLRFDFAIFKNNKIFCLIEYQGQQHYHSIDYFGGAEQYRRQLEYDERKRAFCLQKGYVLIGIPYWDKTKIDSFYIKEKIRWDNYENKE